MRYKRSSASDSGPTSKKQKVTADTAKNKQPDAQHNKTTTSPNTASTFYFSNASVERACSKEKKKIEDECGPDKADGTKHGANNATPDKRQSMLGKVAEKVRSGVLALDAVGKKAYGYTPNGNNDWVGNHCHGQWFKPSTKSEGFEKFKEELDKAQKDLKQEAIDLAKSAGGKIAEKAAQSGKDYLVRTAEKEGAAAVSLLIPGVGEAVEVGTQVWAAVDGVATTVGTVWDAGKFVITQGPEIITKAKALLEQADKISGWLKPKAPGIQDLWATSMAAAAEANQCLRARKCKLVPYDKTKKPSAQANSGEGCCPGQTGHHVLPDAMFYDYVPDGKGGSKQASQRSCWGNYKHGDAPTICLEGTTNSATNGSHGLAHFATEQIVKPYVKSQDMPYIKARDEICDVLGPAYGCSPACLKAQLNEYYKKAHTCGSLDKANLTPHSGNSGGGPEISGGAND